MGEGVSKERPLFFSMHLNLYDDTLLSYFLTSFIFKDNRFFLPLNNSCFVTKNLR